MSTAWSLWGQFDPSLEGLVVLCWWERQSMCLMLFISASCWLLCCRSESWHSCQQPPPWWYPGWGSALGHEVVHPSSCAVICHRRAHTAALTRADPYTTFPNFLPPCPAGTIVYMPKELLLSGRMTPATDIYSFGLMSEWMFICWL